MPMRALDDEIRAVELRLAQRRNIVAALTGDWAGALRDTLVSGKSLLGVAAVGFAVGEILRPAAASGTRRRRSLGGAGSVLLGLASFVLRARYGSPWQLAASAIDAWRRRRPAGALSAAPRAGGYRD
jgi:hypothetical protein